MKSLERKYLLLSSLNKDMGGAGSPTFKLLSAERQKEIASRVRDIALIKSLSTIQIYLKGSFLVNNLLTSHRCGYVWAKRGSVVTKHTFFPFFVRAVYKDDKTPAPKAGALTGLRYTPNLLKKWVKQKIPSPKIARIRR